MSEEKDATASIPGATAPSSRPHPGAGQAGAGKSGLWRRPPSALFVVLVAFAIYNANFRVIHTGDSVPARLLPFALLRDHTLKLDGWVKPYLNADGKPVYYLAESGGHQMSVYPIVLPLLITPLYVAPSSWLARHKPPVPMEGLAGFEIINTMEKLSAAMVAALSVAFCMAPCEDS